MRSNGSSAAAFEPVTALCLLSVCVNRQLVQQNSRPALKSLVGPSLCSRRRRPSPPSLAMAGPQKQVNLMDMPFPQLGAIKQQLDQEIDLLTQSVQQLTSARNKFQESGDCIQRQKSLGESAHVLVPLTSSMYVPGTIVNKERFLIDIGTGYYVEKETTAAQDFFARKVTFLNTQMEKYVRILQEKSFLRESVIEVVQIKQQQMLASASANASAVASVAAGPVSTNDN